ncbi:F-box only protein 30-like isoform X2 [Panulirus ornatus]|uniref:F-box only protein 30-like isoform X2 n=1 Tax=Panulirus ornatus TaxID=150431 RepID=UPI003A898905
MAPIVFLCWKHLPFHKEMEAPVDSDTEEGSDESVSLPEDFEEEVDINIHFHCEHCIKMMKCQERPKPGWCCEMELCSNGCGHKFHVCKTDEHRLICSHERVPCINAGYGCPLWMQRRFLAEHLPFCPASVIICNAEWNRWALGAKEREKVAMAKGVTALYDSTDLDMALALHDQELVNEMQKMPKKVRTTLCNGITRRFPCLPLMIRGSRHETAKECLKSQKMTRSATDEEEDDLTPGLSVSVCTELLRGKKQGLSCTSSEGRGTTNPTHPFTNPNSLDDVNNPATDYGSTSRKSSHSGPAPKSDDISALCCTHGIIKDICIFCREDPDEPDFKMGKVWREHISVKKPGKITWTEEPCVEKIRKRNPFGIYTYKRYDESDEDEEEGETLDKMNLIFDNQGRPIGKRVRFQTPPPAPLTSKGLTMELTLKHYSRHQTKPRAMFTFQCMQEVRRSEFSSHYQNVHSEIQEGLDGWLIHRCPLHVFGCPYVYNRLYPGHKDGNVVYCHSLNAFGIQPKLNHEHSACDGLPGSHSSVDNVTSAISQMPLTPLQKALKAIPENRRMSSREAAGQYYASSINLTYLPIEVLQTIASYLDGFSLNNLSLTCRLMRDICLSLLNERGLVILEWVRYIENGQVRWRQGKKRRFFSKAFEHVNHWGFRDTAHMANHLQSCPFNNRQIAEKKFAYVQPRKDGTIRSHLRNCRV